MICLRMFYVSFKYPGDEDIARDAATARAALAAHARSQVRAALANALPLVSKAVSLPIASKAGGAKPDWMRHAMKVPDDRPLPWGKRGCNGGAPPPKYVPPPASRAPPHVVPARVALHVPPPPHVPHVVPARVAACVGIHEALAPSDAADEYEDQIPDDDDWALAQAQLDEQAQAQLDEQEFDEQEDAEQEFDEQAPTQLDGDGEALAEADHWPWQHSDAFALEEQRWNNSGARAPRSPPPWPVQPGPRLRAKDKRGSVTRGGKRVQEKRKADLLGEQGLELLVPYQQEAAVAEASGETLDFTDWCKARRARGIEGPGSSSSSSSSRSHHMAWSEMATEQWGTKRSKW